jgi:septal ring factor EnvC (AmiA/AmiB activator)
MTMTLDKDFLMQLEHSFKRLAQSTEKVKHLTREKDQFEKQYLHLKDKVMKLKEERTLMALEKDQLVQQCHQLEFRLKQAQVILNLGEQETNKSRTR